MAAALWTLPALQAHHSFAAEFDTAKPVKMTGVVTKVEWQNPHIWFYVDVKGSDGAVTNWGFSGGAPGQLMRRGITKDLLQIGSTVIGLYYLAFFAANALVGYVGGLYSSLPTTTFWLIHVASAAFGLVAFVIFKLAIGRRMQSTPRDQAAVLS